MGKEITKIKNEHARMLLLIFVLILGFINVYWVSVILGNIYIIIGIVLLAWAKHTGDRNVLIASRFWVLVVPFIGVFNGPSKLGWLLAFLAASWLASKNAFPDKKSNKDVGSNNKKEDKKKTKEEQKHE